MPSLEDLEQVYGEVALNWAKEQNDRTFNAFTKDANFRRLEQNAREIMEADDKLPGISIDPYGNVYNFWNDKDHVRGLLRRTTIDEYKKPNPQWENLLDIDQLSIDENENWVYGGIWKLRDSPRCMIHLSKGGGDSTVIREFDLDRKEFVSDGFNLPDAKTDCNWLGEDYVLVATDFGPDSLTNSSYPRIVKIWQRGTDLKDAIELFSIPKEEMGVEAFALSTPTNDYAFVYEAIDFNTNRIYQVSFNDFSLKLIPKPEDALFAGMYNDQMLLYLQTAWVSTNGTYPPGSLVAIDLVTTAPDGSPVTELILAATDTMSITAAAQSKDSLFVQVSENVVAQVYKMQRIAGKWVHEKLMVPGNNPKGNTYIASVSNTSDLQLIYYEDFITPSQQWLSHAGANFELLKIAPHRFDASNVTFEQLHATSKDGTKIPYYIVHSKDMPRDNQNPTLLYGYGGFEVTITPWYLSAWGKNWIENGNVLVIANIRGGGEFGPQWHQAAIKDKRQNAFDDFIAVAEDLIQRGVTSPSHLGIEGGSNGGLLVAAVTMQRPDLFNAVISAVPLTDMLRYTKLNAGAGASWVEEYGDPEDPVMREALAKYSPLHNIKPIAEQKYPVMLFTTSTKDDRVHPYHARAMVNELQQNGHDVYYYENSDGGHQLNANYKQEAFTMGMEMNYLYKQLCKPRLELVSESEIVDEVLAEVVTEEIIETSAQRRLRLSA